MYPALFSSMNLSSHHNQTNTRFCLKSFLDSSRRDFHCQEPGDSSDVGSFLVFIYSTLLFREFSSNFLLLLDLWPFLVSNFLLQ